MYMSQINNYFNDIPVCNIGRILIFNEKKNTKQKK